MSELIRNGLKFPLGKNTFGKISGVYALGFHYHTVDAEGNCIKGEQYMLKADFKLEQGVKN
jgi:hypothetical protein